MNQLTILLCALVAAATAAPQFEHGTQVPILRQAGDGPNPDGSYSYSYETGNGIQVEEQGHVNYAGTDAEALEATGGYTYTGPNGEVFRVTYVANENGFQPQGDHIPTVPIQIQRALEYIAAHPEENNIDAQ